MVGKGKDTTSIKMRYADVLVSNPTFCLANGVAAGEAQSAWDLDQAESRLLD